MAIYKGKSLIKCYNFLYMTKDFNYKPYLICVLALSLIICIFSYKSAICLLLGTAYFFISDKLNQWKFPSLNSKGLAVGKVFLVIFIQFILIVGVALSSFYIGGIPSLLVSFAGITIPHIYFIIAELRKIKK